LKLADKAGFLTEKPGALSRVLILLGMRNNPADMSLEDRALEKLRKNLNIFEISGSRVIVVQYTSPNSTEAAEIANAVADTYIALQRAAKLESTDDATGWLAPEIEDLRSKLRES